MSWSSACRGDAAVFLLQIMSRVFAGNKYNILLSAFELFHGILGDTVAEKKFFIENLLSILIPVYNERAYIRAALTKVLAVKLPRGLERELVIVNDASTDGTEEIILEFAAEYPEIKYFRQEINQGKGAAIRRAIQEMQGEYVIIQDADLEYDPDEYPVVLRPLLEGHADVVYGSRFANREMRRILLYHHKLGNLFLTHMSNFFTGLDLSDMETCYKAFRGDVLKTIPLRSNRFGMEPEITAKVAKRDCSIFEVPISYYGRSYAEGKKIGWKDGFQAIYTILKFWIIDDCYSDEYTNQLTRRASTGRRFCRWLVEQVIPSIGNKTLEVGAGIGNISRMLPKKEKLTVTDGDPELVSLIEQIYADNELVDVEKLDLTVEEDVQKFGGRGIDTVVLLSGVQKYADDLSALRNAGSILESGGRLLLQVPNNKFLFGSIDREEGFLRRYSRQDIKKLLEEAGFVVEKCRGMNSLSVPFWYLNSVVFKRKHIPLIQLKFLDTLFFFWKYIDKVIPFPGLSLLLVARKK